MNRREPVPEQVRPELPGLMLVMVLGPVDQAALASALPEVAVDPGGPQHLPLIAGPILSQPRLPCLPRDYWVTARASAQFSVGV